MRNQLKKNYEAVCNAYLLAFTAKHEYDFEDARWIGDRVGEIAEVGDQIVDMVTIRTDIDRDVPEGEFLKWYDYCLKIGMIDNKIPTPNFEHWAMGCPRKSEGEILELEAKARRIEELKQELKDAIERDKNDF